MLLISAGLQKGGRIVGELTDVVTRTVVNNDPGQGTNCLRYNRSDSRREVLSFVSDGRDNDVANAMCHLQVSQILDEMVSLSIPTVALENAPALLYDFLSLPRMLVNPMDGLSKAIGIARFEKHNLSLIEVVSDSFGIRNNDRPFHGEVLEYARGHVEFRERIAAIRNNPQINGCKGLRNL